ncbi:12356_t:CDS:2 [Entrophospora sp. SA101]|nr:12356_t:CDS:2 [Entrophospora sp. SA101]
MVFYEISVHTGSIKFNSQLLHIWPDDDMIRIAFGDSYKEAVTLFKYVDLIEMVYKIENPINRYDSYEILPEKYLNGDESSDSRINEHDNYIIIQHIVDSNGIIFLNLIDRRRKHEAFVSSNLDRKSINNGNIQDSLLQETATKRFLSWRTSTTPNPSTPTNATGDLLLIIKVVLN